MIFFRVGALDCVLEVGVQEATKVGHVVDVSGAPAQLTFRLLQVEKALRRLVVLWADQLADLECGREGSILLHIDRSRGLIMLLQELLLCSLTASILIDSYVADGTFKNSGRVH